MIFPWNFSPCSFQSSIHSYLVGLGRLSILIDPTGMWLSSSVHTSRLGLFSDSESSRGSRAFIIQTTSLSEISRMIHSLSVLCLRRVRGMISGMISVSSVSGSSSSPSLSSSRRLISRDGSSSLSCARHSLFPHLRVATGPSIPTILAMCIFPSLASLKPPGSRPRT